MGSTESAIHAHTQRGFTIPAQKDYEYRYIQNICPTGKHGFVYYGKFIQLNTVVVFGNVNSTCIYSRNHCFKVTLVYGEKTILLLKKHQPLCEISQLERSLYNVQV